MCNVAGGECRGDRYHRSLSEPLETLPLVLLSISLQLFVEIHELTSMSLVQGCKTPALLYAAAARGWAQPFAPALHRCGVCVVPGDFW